MKTQLYIQKWVGVFYAVLHYIEDDFVCLFMMSLILNSDDLEQQCEDALFEVCDARERYPLQCAKELENCIKLTNEICVSIICTTIVIISYSLF